MSVSRSGRRSGSPPSPDPLRADPREESRRTRHSSVLRSAEVSFERSCSSGALQVAPVGDPQIATPTPRTLPPSARRRLAGRPRRPRKGARRPFGPAPEVRCVPRSHHGGQIRNSTCSRGTASSAPTRLHDDLHVLTPSRFTQVTQSQHPREVVLPGAQAPRTADSILSAGAAAPCRSAGSRRRRRGSLERVHERYLSRSLLVRLRSLERTVPRTSPVEREFLPALEEEAVRRHDVGVLGVGAAEPPVTRSG